jgi:hypothetical protein
MNTRTLHPTAAGLALLLLAVPPVAAQAIAYGEPPPIRSRAEALAERYHVRLTSAWPQLRGGDGCENGGDEVVEGTLIRAGDGGYTGTLTRTTRLLFCGAHGPAGDRCALVLDGQGGVAMRGVVLPDDRSPTGRVLRVVWSPGPEHTARVNGDCGTRFKEEVERMYLSARHGAEFALPNAGAAPRAERLEDYAWVVEVE